MKYYLNTSASIFGVALIESQPSWSAYHFCKTFFYFHFAFFHVILVGWVSQRGDQLISELFTMTLCDPNFVVS